MVKVVDYFLKKKKTLKQKLKVILLSLISIYCIIRLVLLIDLTQIGMYNRFANFGKDASSDTSLREESWVRAWNHFLDSPLFGSSYVDLYDYSYPHNIYLEVLMATGLIGGILFFTSLFIFFLKKIKNVNSVGVFLIFIIAALSSFFSGSLFINPFLWCILGLMTQFEYIEGKSLNYN